MPDLYELLAVPIPVGGSSLAGSGEDTEPSPWTILTKTVETTDESGLIPALVRLTP